MKNKNTIKPIISFMLVLAMVLTLTMIPVPAYADMDVDHDRISVAEGEPVTLAWDSSTSTGGAIVTTTAINYYPSSFVLYAYNATTPSGVGVTATFLYDTPGGKAYRIDLPGSATTISVTLADSEYGGNREYVLRCQAPQGVAPGGAKPAYVNGYLPVGQYATGTGWGSIFSNGTNLTGTTVKFLNGYGSTGVSLGAGGGYVQFEFSNVVRNKDTNPYGVDFIIYGNPFNGNPEAGAVKVSTDGAVWYDLAGSLYYDAKSKNNVDVTFKKVTTTSAAFTTTGIYYKIDNGSWTKFNTNTSVAWWPEYSTEGYGTVSGISSIFRGSITVDGATWDTTNNEITYSDISLIKDTDATNDYQFGYFDVRANGSNYATAVNPYATQPTANNGGDGYDISWAVNESGEPINLDSIKYVRAYTSACLNTTGDAFTVPSIFGETSAEVCGIYVANGTGSGIAVEPDFLIDDTFSFQDLEDLGLGISVSETVVSSNQKIITVTGLNNYPNSPFDLDVTGGASYTFMNDAATTSTAVDVSGGAKYIRVIVQSGTAEPYVILLKLS